LNGNVDYKNGKRNYGGAIRKIMNIVHEDEESLEIMRQIMALRDSDW
jgi:DNA-binding FrmR family transcriptional regulator